MILTYQKENVEDVISEIKVLSAINREEVQEFDNFFFDPDWATYLILARDGNYILYTVRTKVGTLVGYIGFMLQTLLHHRSHGVAIVDALFLHPSVRKGLAGYKLMRTSIEDIKKRKVFGYSIDCIKISSKSKFPIDKLAERLGFTFTEKVYYKEI